MMSASAAKPVAHNEINSFTGTFEFLSNFLAQPVIYNNRAYKSAEHAYQAAKPLLPEVHDLIQEAKTPRDARHLGGLCELRPDWREVKLQVMEDILRYKFSQPHLQERLLATGDKILIEGNTWKDRFWGCERESGKWVGENHLGKLLMKLRDEIRTAK